MPAKNKRLRIMAGPNGSGKSTILREVRSKFYSGPFINADDIENALRDKGLINLPTDYQLEIENDDFSHYLNSEGKGWISKAESENTAITLSLSNGMLVSAAPSMYDAALAADFIRYQLLRSGKTFTFETVMSHSSKIDFLNHALKAGYKNYLYFICTVDAAINIERVKQRVALGGHSVPAIKIEKRFTESLNLLDNVIPLCHRVYLFDNSTEERSIEPVAEINSKKELIVNSNMIPWWIDEYVIKTLYKI